MSALTKFQPNFRPGHLRYHIDSDKQIDGYIKCDGSLALVNAYPKLVDNIGFIKDKTNVTGTLVNSNTIVDILDLTYGNGIYVYSGIDGVLASSSDATNWTTRTSGTVSNINALAYGNGTFVYGGDEGVIGTSTDGITWTKQINEKPTTYVGGKTFARAGSTSTTNVSLTDLTGGANTAPQANDLVVIAVATSTETQTSLAVSGYIEIASVFQEGTLVGLGFVEDSNLWVGYKIMGPTPDTTVTIPACASIDDAQTVAIQVWRNVEFVNSTTGSGSGSGSAGIVPNPPAIITTSPKNIVLVIGAGAYDNNPATFSASYANNFLTVGSGDINDSTIGMGSVLVSTPQTYDPPAFSATSTPNGSHSEVTVALRPKESITSLTYGNGTFVYAGFGGNLATSTDGVTWTTRTSGTTSIINALKYNNNTFVYGTINNVFGTSTDGTTWTTNNLEQIYVGGKTFARAGATSTTNVSLTDLTGGANTAPQEGDLVVIAVATGSIAQRSQAVSGYTQIAALYSNDDHDTNLWVGYKIMGPAPDTTVTIPSTGSTADAQTVAIHVWRNVEFVNSTTTTSVNTAIADPPTITVSEDNSIVLVVGAAGHTDGTDTFSASYANNFLSVGFNDTYDSTIGMGSVFRSTSGSYNPAAFTFSGTSTANNSSASVTIDLRPRINSILDVEYANGTFVISGRYGGISTSSDGVTWTSRTSGTTSDINGLSYNNAENLFAYVTADGSLRTSTNGITWTTRTSGTPLNLYTILSAGPFIYAGSQGVLGTLSSFTYNPNVEFLLPTSNSIFQINSDVFTPTAFIKYE